MKFLSITLWFAILIYFLIPLTLQAQGGGPPPPGDPPPPLPINKNILLLSISGLVFGLYVIAKKR
jgi:hypothetical protein